MKSKKIFAILAIFTCFILVTTQAVSAEKRTIKGTVRGILELGDLVYVWLDLDDDGKTDICLELCGVDADEMELLQKSLEKGWRITLYVHDHWYYDDRLVLDEVILILSVNCLSIPLNDGMIYS